MSNFVHKVKDAITDDKRNAPGSRGNRAPPGEHGSLDPRTTESVPKQYNSSNMNHSSGMGFNNPHGSRRSDDEPGANRDPKGNGWFLLTYCSFPVLPTFVFMLIEYVESHRSSDPDTYRSTDMGEYCSPSAGSENVKSGPHDSKLANSMDPRVDSDMGRSG